MLGSRWMLAHNCNGRGSMEVKLLERECFICLRWMAIAVVATAASSLLWHDTTIDSRWGETQETCACIQRLRTSNADRECSSRLSLTARATSLAVSPPSSPSSSSTARRSSSSAARPSTSLESSSAPSVRPSYPTAHPNLFYAISCFELEPLSGAGLDEQSPQYAHANRLGKKQKER